MTDQEKLETIERLIKARYAPKDGAKTSLFSEGNGDDQFSDGEARGVCRTLYDIAVAIEMALPEPHEQVYDY